MVFDGDRFLDGGATVLVDGEQVVGVEPARFEPPDGCPVTTYDGTLLPGLVDAHVHLVSSGLPGSLEAAGTLSDDDLDTAIRGSLATQAAAGVTTVRDLGDTRFRTLLHRAAATPLLPRILAAGPPVTVPEGHCHYLGGVVDGPDAVRAAIKERVEQGVDVVKVMASGGMLTVGSDVTGVQFSAEDLRVLVEQAHEAGLRVLAHAHSLAGIRHAVAAGVDGLEHVTGLVAGGRDLPDELLAEIAASGIVVDPTFGFDEEAFHQFAPPPHVLALLAASGQGLLEAIEERVGDAGRFHAHGVRVVSGLDAGAAPPKMHGNLWRAVHDLVRGGFPLTDALVTATGGAADACGLADVTGRLRPGLAADLLVVDGDLRADVTVLSRPVAVLLRGEQLQ